MHFVSFRARKLSQHLQPSPHHFVLKDIFVIYVISNFFTQCCTFLIHLCTFFPRFIWESYLFAIWAWGFPKHASFSKWSDDDGNTKLQNFFFPSFFFLHPYFSFYYLWYVKAFVRRKKNPHILLWLNIWWKSWERNAHRESHLTVYDIQRISTLEQFPLMNCVRMCVFALSLAQFKVLSKTTRVNVGCSKYIRVKVLYCETFHSMRFSLLYDCT